MLSSGRTWSSLFFVVLASTVVPVTSAQSLSSLLKTLQQASSSDTASIFKSFAETIQGQLPSGTQVENADGKVVLYRTAWCGYCKKTAAYMRQKFIPFLERDIEANAGYKAEYAKLGGNGSVPFIVFGQKTIYGFSESTFDKNYSDFQVAMVATPPAKGGGPAEPAKEHSNGLDAGLTVVGKIPGVRVYAQPNRTAERLMVLGKADEVVYMGEEKDGLYRVTTAKGEGWVDKLLVKQP